MTASVEKKSLFMICMVMLRFFRVTLYIDIVRFSCLYTTIFFGIHGVACT
jgi:hypothetical protein